MLTKLRSDRATPNIVLARAPWNKRDIIELYCYPETITNMFDDGWRAKIGEYCGLIHGKLVEMRGECERVDETGTNGLLDSIALFQGVKRPMKQPGVDEEVYTYITTPSYSYTYPKTTHYTQVGRQLGNSRVKTKRRSVCDVRRYH